MYIYLASPYTHAEESVMEARYQGVLKALTVCLECGVPVFSPIAQWHPVSKTFPEDRPIDFEPFQFQDLSLVAGCQEFWVLCLDGWESSSGVKMEEMFARDCNKHIRFVHPQNLQDLCIFTRKGLEKHMSSLSERLLARMRSARDYHSSDSPGSNKISF